MMPLHVLRRVPPRINGRPVTLEQFVRLSRRWERRPAIRFGSWTARRPRRAGELEGGSVYYCRGNPAETVFRMELDCIERVTDFDSGAEEKFRSHWSFTCHPAVIMVETKRIGFLRGWRYLADADAPADLPVPAGERGD